MKEPFDMHENIGDDLPPEAVLASARQGASNLREKLLQLLDEQVVLSEKAARGDITKTELKRQSDALEKMRRETEKKMKLASMHADALWKKISG